MLLVLRHKAGIRFNFQNRYNFLDAAYMGQPGFFLALTRFCLIERGDFSLIFFNDW